MKKKSILLIVTLALLTSCNGNLSLPNNNDSNATVSSQTPESLPPSSDSGFEEVNFDDAKPVKNVTELGMYLGGCPTTGDVNVLVLPVEFSDKKATSKQALSDLDKALNGKNPSDKYLSVADYYKESSYGKLNLNFEILGGGQKYFQASKPSTYYTSGSSYSNKDVELIDDILSQADSSTDYSKYDRDGNGAIDAVVVVPVLDINYDQSTLNWAYRFWAQNDAQYDGEMVNDFLWCPYDFLYDSSDGNYDNPTPTVTYTLIHEFGHILGADDYYDTNYTYKDQINRNPMRGEDVMDSKYGDHDPYTKFYYGWINKSRYINGDAVTLNISPFESNGETFIVSNNFDPKLGAFQEYWVMMFYSKTGINSTSDYSFNKGLVIYHVNSTLKQVTQDGKTYYVVANNNDLGGKYMTDNRLISLANTRTADYTIKPNQLFLPFTIKDDSQESFPYHIKINSMTDSNMNVTFSKDNLLTL